MAFNSGARLLKEYRAALKSGRTALAALGDAQVAAADLVLVFPVDTSRLNVWTAFLSGGQGTPFADAMFELRINIPPTYPLQPPSIRFVTPVFHPNVHFKTGEICLDILQKEWSPAWTVESACRAVLALLAHPEPDSPLNCDAGNLLRAADVLGYGSLARMYVLDHALNMEQVMLRLPHELRSHSNRAASHQQK